MQPNKNSIWANIGLKNLHLIFSRKKLHAILSKSEFQEFWTRSMVFRVVIIIFWSNSELNFSPKKYYIIWNSECIYTKQVIIAMPTTGWIHTHSALKSAKKCNLRDVKLFASKARINIFLKPFQMEQSRTSLWSLFGYF